MRTIQTIWDIVMSRDMWSHTFTLFRNARTRLDASDP